MVFVITSQSQNLKEREAEIVLFVLSPDTSQEPLLKVQATCSSCVHFTPEEAGVSAWWPGMKEPVCSQLVTQQADVTPGAVRAQEVRRPSKEPAVRTSAWRAGRPRPGLAAAFSSGPGAETGEKDERTGLALPQSLQVRARVCRGRLPQALGSWGVAVDTCGGGVGGAGFRCHVPGRDAGLLQFRGEASHRIRSYVSSFH